MRVTDLLQVDSPDSFLLARLDAHFKDAVDLLDLLPRRSDQLKMPNRKRAGGRYARTLSFFSASDICV